MTFLSDGLIALVLSTSFVFYYCIFIGVIALGHVLLLIKMYISIKKDVNRLNKHIEVIHKHDILHYDIEEDVGKRTPIAEVWGLYARQLIRQDATVGLHGRTYYSAQSAHEFFNEETYLEVIANLAGVRALPSVLTGLGILGTFMGLAAGIQSADQFTRDGLMPLLNGAGLAFCTSIVGIALSLFVTGINKCWIHKSNNQLISLANRLDAAFPVMNRKDFDYQSLKMLQLCAKSISSIQMGIDEHHKEVSQRLESVLRSLVTEFTERLSVEIVGMGQSFNEAVEGAAKEIRHSADSFGHSVIDVRDCLKEGISAIDTSVQMATENIDEARSKMNDELIMMTTNVSNTVKSMIDDNQVGLEAIEKMSDHLALAAADFEQRNDTWLKTANESLREASQSLTAHFTEQGIKFADSMVARTASLNEGVQSLLQQVETSTEKTAKAFNDLAERNDVWQNATNQSIREASTSLTDHFTAQGSKFAEKVVEQTVALTEGVQSLLQQVESSTQKTAKAFDDLAARNDAWQKATNQSILEASASLTDHFTDQGSKFAEKVTEQTAALTEGVQSLVKLLDQSSERTTRTFDELANNVSKASNDMLDVQAQLFEQSRDVAVKHTELIAQDFRKQTAILAEGYRDELSKFSDRLEQSAVAVENANKDIAASIFGQMTEASDQIAARYKDIAQLSEDIESKLRMLSGVEIEGRKQLDEKLQAIQSVISALHTVNKVVAPIGDSVKALQQVEGVLNRAASANESAGRSMADASKEMKEYIERVRNSVGTTIDEADLKLANIVKVLNKTVQDWNDNQSRSALKLLEAADQIRRMKDERSGTLL